MKKKENRIGKKTAAGILAISVLCTAVSVPTFLKTCVGAASISAASGDLNGDGNVTSADVKILQNALLNNTKLTKDQFANADVVSDGAVNGNDLTKLRQMAANTDPLADCIQIHLSDSGIQVEGDTKGVTSVSGKTVTIGASGTYLVDGSITDGQVLINVADTTADAEDVSVFLQDVTMTSSTGAPCIYAQSSAKVKLTCGGENTLTDTAAAANADISGVIAANCDLTVTKNSTGKLNITSSMNRGIFCKDDLKLNGGTINVTTDVDQTSDADAIRANNTLEIDGAVVSIDSSADGLKSNKEDVVITSGKVQIKAGNDAVQAVTAISISGGEVIACGDRGFTLEANGALNITGGDVLATATDYAFGQTAAGTALTIDTSGSTQNIMQLSYAEEWKKDNAVTLRKNGSTVFEMTPVKKFDYVLISSGNIDTSSTYQLYTDGTQMCHSGSATGEFKMNGSSTTFTDVKAMSGGGEISSDDNIAASLVYSENSIQAYNAAGAEIAAPTNLSISGTAATITASSEISVSGACSNGQLTVNVDKTAEPTGLVTLNLEGLTLSNPTSAPIYVESIGDEVAIFAKNGSTNTISDGTSHTDTYVDSDGNTNTVNGAIFSRDDLKIKGKGTLIVNGNTEDGIVCKNDLKIWNGSITVNAKDDGVRGNDSVRVGDPNAADYSTLKLTVNTNNKTYGGDGIKSTSTDAEKGYVTINGGTIDIHSYADGIQAEQTFTMNGGNVTIETYTGAGTASSGGNNGPGNMGGWNQGGNTSTSSDVSAKGIKSVGLYDTAGTTYQSGGDLNIFGGTLNINSTDDSLHCAGTMSVTAGTLTLATGDDGIHSDSALNIGTEGNTTDYSNPKIEITQSYEGVEAVDITLNSGTVLVTSSDDGYNAAGGADSSGSAGGGWNQGGWGSGMMGSGSQTLVINGGYTYVNAAGDGLDSNGSLTVNGGYAFVSQTGGGNSPIDCDSTWNYNGGVVIAGGSGDMFSESIPNSYSFVNQSASVSAGTTVTFTDSNNNIAATMTFANAAQAIVMCCSDSSVTAYTSGTISGATYFDVPSNNSNMKAGYGGTISGGTTLSAGSASGGGGFNPGGRSTFRMTPPTF